MHAKSMRTVLIIDDNPAVGEALSLLLSLHEVRPLVAHTPEEGLARLSRERVDVVIQDMNFTADTTSGEEGANLFRAIRKRHADLPVILLTAWTHLESAVELVKAGAADYLAKPWDDAKLLTTVENMLELSEASRAAAHARAERTRRREELAAQYDLRGLVFSSEGMSRAVELACRVGRADVPVLITGPNGAGKDGIAQIVHFNSAVRDKAFVAVNCGALPSELVEAELFGAEAGAYTGATRAREGRFELADGGTLFLDEIGTLPLPGQVKLLRVLESGEFERLGSGRTRKVKVRVISATNADLKAMIRAGTFREDLYYRLNVIETGEFERLGSGRTRKVKVRVISATNADLKAMIRAGTFREDLYYRLNVFEVDVPPLSDRLDDILPLAEHFIAGRAHLNDAAREALLAYAWPGNVRELKNAIERAALLAGERGTITPAQLNLPQQTATAATRNLDEPSQASVETALRNANGVISRAAQALGLSRQALYRRMERYGIPTAG